MVASKKSPSVRAKAKHSVAEKAKKSVTRLHAASNPTGTITIDRREKSDRRGSEDHRKKSVPGVAVHPLGERRAKVNRRRQIDPTTCERDYTPDEVEFMGAMDAYKRRSGRMFPTCSEVLEVIKSLGYTKQTQVELPTVPAPESVVVSDELATVV